MKILEVRAVMPALIRWLLTLEAADRQGAYRGLDILHFRDGRLVEKHTYAKAEIPLIRKKAALAAEGAWPATADRGGGG